MHPDALPPRFSVCCQCRKPLPENREPGSWYDAGFCCAPCALAFHLAYASFPHDDHAGSVLNECVKALSEVTNKKYYKCHHCSYVFDSADVPPVENDVRPGSLFCADCRSVILFRPDEPY